MSDLWIFRGNKPVLWRIPVKVVLKHRDDLHDHRPGRNNATPFLEAAVPLLGVQRSALYAHFERHKNLVFHEGQWRFTKIREAAAIPRRMKALGATPSPDDDPELQLVWGPRRPPLRKLSEEDKTRRLWLEELLAGGTGESVEQLDYFWRAFCLHIAHTLINGERPVDFYWFKLHNCPLRTGWQAVLSYRKLAATQPKTVLRAILGHANLLAYDNEREHCLRHVEVEHGPEWWKLIRATERARVRSGTHHPELYAESFQKSLVRFALAGWRLYCCWREEMAQVGVLRVPHRSGGGFRFVPGSLERQMYRKIRKSSPTARPANIWHLRQAIAAVAKTLPRPNGCLSKMPHLRPEAETVRQPADDGAGTAVDQPGDGPGGSDGLLVRLTDEKLVPEREVLAARTGIDGDGLAGGT